MLRYALICTDTKQANTVLASKSSKCSLQEGVKPTEPAADINFKTTSMPSNKEWRYYASVLFWISNKITLKRKFLHIPMCCRRQCLFGGQGNQPTKRKAAGVMQHANENEKAKTSRPKFLIITIIATTNKNNKWLN